MIKKGNLNYDQSGRAYPDKPQIQENWDCIWEYDGKHYKLVGDDEHKEWEEVNLYNQIIDEAYENYFNNFLGYDDVPTKEVFVFESTFDILNPICRSRKLTRFSS